MKPLFFFDVDDVPSILHGFPPKLRDRLLHTVQVLAENNRTAVRTARPHPTPRRRAGRATLAKRLARKAHDLAMRAPEDARVIERAFDARLRLAHAAARARVRVPDGSWPGPFLEAIRAAATEQDAHDLVIAVTEDEDETTGQMVRTIRNADFRTGLALVEVLCEIATPRKDD